MCALACVQKERAWRCDCAGKVSITREASAFGASFLPRRRAGSSREPSMPETEDALSAWLPGEHLFTSGNQLLYLGMPSPPSTPPKQEASAAAAGRLPAGGNLQVPDQHPVWCSWEQAAQARRTPLIYVRMLHQGERKKTTQPAMRTPTISVGRMAELEGLALPALPTAAAGNIRHSRGRARVRAGRAVQPTTLATRSAADGSIRASSSSLVRRSPSAAEAFAAFSESAARAPLGTRPVGRGSSHSSP